MIIIDFAGGFQYSYKGKKELVIALEKEEGR